MKNKIILGCFFLVAIGLILSAGCLSLTNDEALMSTPTPIFSPIQTPTPQIVYVIVTVTQTTTPIPEVVTTISTTPLPSINPTIVPTEAPDPVTHRWIHITNNATLIDGNLRYWGEELHFYSDGTVSYQYGIAKEISSNYAINDPTLYGTGTWSKVGDNEYIVKVSNPLLDGSTPKISNVYFYPGGINPMYPGINFSAYLEVQEGTDRWKFNQAKSDRPPT
jgi:hypothetical protein